MKTRLLIILSCFGSTLTAVSALAAEDSNLKLLKNMSLEALMNLEITIAGKTPQKSGDVPASVYVITQEDIQSMGATSIPEALRLVPGMQVARIDANKWAVSIRGFNNLFTTKLLVMIDGRTVYSPLYSGVHWDVQDTVLEDIERIEVVRGPGASAWGANAVSGVINIITKTAKATQGTLLTGTIGTEQGIASARYGAQLANNIAYRVYGKYRNQDNRKFADNSKASDGWHDIKGGFRVDWHTDTNSEFTLQGDIYTGKTAGQVNMISPNPPSFSTLTDRTGDIWGANLLTRWTKNMSGGASQEIQFYYDYSFRNAWLGKVKRGTLDLDYKYQFAPVDRHTIAVGAGYRFTHDETEGDPFVTKGILTPNNRQYNLFSAFLHDDITLINDTVWLTLGSKFEHNDFSGFEIQPSARLRWQPLDKHLLWASVSRAVRTPSRIEHDTHLLLDTQADFTFAVQGNKDFDSEELLAYEIGYRTQAFNRLGIEFSLFYNDYDHLQSSQPKTIGFPEETEPVVIFLSDFNNQFDAEAYGLELAINWQPTEKWLIKASYSNITLQLHNPDTRPDQFIAESYEDQTPEHQISLLSSYALSHDISFNLFGRYVDKMPSPDPELAVASHFDIDMGLHWRVTQSLTLALYGRNLAQTSQFEYKQAFITPTSTKTERNAYLTFKWQP